MLKQSKHKEQASNGGQCFQMFRKILSEKYCLYEKSLYKLLR